jgi:hypothetical protein
MMAIVDLVLPVLALHQPNGRNGFTQPNGVDKSRKLRTPVQLTLADEQRRKPHRFLCGPAGSDFAFSSFVVYVQN